jgi:hypothetical protein
MPTLLSADISESACGTSVHLFQPSFARLKAGLSGLKSINECSMFRHSGLEYFTSTPSSNYRSKDP